MMNNTILRPTLLVGRYRNHICKPKVSAPIQSSAGFHYKSEEKVQDDWLPTKCPVKVFDCGTRFAKKPCSLKQTKVEYPVPAEPERLLRTESSIPIGFFDHCCKIPTDEFYRRVTKFPIGWTDHCCKRGPRDAQNLTHKIFRRPMPFQDPCCAKPCIPTWSRADDLYYSRSDKFRKFQRTWNECDWMIKQPKNFIRIEEDVPKWEIKPRKPRKQVSEARVKCLHLFGRCPRILNEHCAGARTPPDSHVYTHHHRCMRFPTPYPAYSECDQLKRPPYRYVECKCCEFPKMCEVWRQFHHREHVKKIIKMDRQYTLQQEVYNAQMVHFHSSYKF